MPRKYAGPLQPGKKSAYVPKTRRNKVTVKNLTSKIKSVALSQVETKCAGQQQGAISGAAAVDLYHNVSHYVPNLLATKQAITANPGANVLTNRIGNEVLARGLKLRLQIVSDPAHPNINLRGFVFRYEANEAPSDANFWAGPLGGGGTMLRMLDSPDTRNVTILKSFLVQNRNVSFNAPQTSVTSTRYVHNVYKDIWIPLKNKKIVYDSNDSEIPKYTTIGMCILAFDANNTAQTDILSYLSWTSKFYFKDP